jgi:N-carbamoylputrescine amidase
MRLEQSDFLLLPEMPFYRWLAASPELDPDEWRKSVASHESWMRRLEELGDVTVASTIPVTENGENYNLGFVWDRRNGLNAVHKKCYLPEEEGFWEASWYSRGKKHFTPILTPAGSAGFVICTELWFFQHAREYGRGGVHMLLCPRATPMGTEKKWIVGGRAAAVVSGAYCLSSNFSGHDERFGSWAGNGWIIEPEAGEVLGTTSPEAPFLTIDIDPDAADAAKHSYPRYVVE